MLSIENKKAIAFIGDSIIENGVFINYIRKSLKKSNIENYIFNKGYPGFRMDIAHVPLEEDFDLCVPDYAVICFGINDIGIFQLSHQVCFHRIDVDSAQLVPFDNFFFRQTFCLGLVCQFIDSCDDFIHFHNVYLT